MTDRKNRVPNRIREERERSRLSQRELGLLIGIDATSVAKHEAGSRIPTAEQAEAYAQVFKLTSAAQLFVNLPEEAQLTTA